MVSTNADYNKATESSTNKSEIIEAAAASEDASPTTAISKHTLSEVSDDLVCSSTTSTSSSLTEAFATSTISKCQSQTVVHSATVTNLNFLSRLQGQRWQQNFDFEKVLKQMRHAEKAHFKMFEMENSGSGNNIGGSNSGGSSKASSVVAAAVATSSGATLSIKAKLFKYPQRFQVKRLSGNDMHYYSLAPKHQALEIVVCNACKGIYTIVGFSNHVMRQHPSIWSSLPSKTQIPHTYPFEAMTNSSAKSSQTLIVDVGQRDDTQISELERIELVGISSDSSATASSSTSSSSTSSSLASSFGSTARVAKGNRNICSSSNNATNICGSVVSSSVRSRTKTGKQHMPAVNVLSTVTTSTPAAVLPALTLPVSLQSVASPSPATELLLTSLTSVNNTKSASKKSSTAATLISTPTTPAALSNVTAKVLPTFGIVSGGSGASISNSNRNPQPALAISSFSNSSSNSSTSSSSSSSTTSSSKTSSQSTTSTPSLTFPTLLSMPLADASNNATGQFEIVSSTTAYYVENLGKGIQSGNNFLTDSFEKTDDNATITSISEMRDLIENVATSAVTVPISSIVPSTPTNHVSSAAISQNVTGVSIGEHQLLDATVVSNGLSSTPKVKFLPEHTYESPINISVSKHDKTDISASESLISSSVDVLQSATALQNSNNSIMKYNGNTERLQMATVSTSVPHQTLLNNKINFDKVCGVMVHAEFSTPCVRPLICSVHTQSAKRQVTGRSKPFDELLLNYCSNKDDKNVLPVSDVVDSSNSSSSTDFERRNIFETAKPSASSCAAAPILTTQESILDNNTLNTSSLSSQKFAKSEVDNGIIQLDANDRALSTVFVKKLSQHQHRTKQSCEERAQQPNLSDENSILTLEGIFDHTTQLEMLSSKFITEILNTDESDINFDDLDTTNNPTTQITRLLQQPAAKRLRLDDESIQQRPQRDNREIATNFKSQQQHLQTYVSDQTMQNHNQNIEHKNDVVYEASPQLPQQQQIEIQYQTELSNVLQQEQITPMEAIQFQQLLYQQCVFNNLETASAVLEQQQHHQIDTACLLNSKELIELSTEEKCYSTDNTKTLLENYSNITSGNNKAWSEYNIDDVGISEAIEWRFNVTQMPSLTDETPATNEMKLDNLVRLSSSRTHSNSAAQCTLPAEDELLFEITSDNQVSIINQQQQQVMAEMLTEDSDYNTVTEIHSNNNNNLYAGFEHHIAIKKPIVSYDFSCIETFKSLPNSVDSKSKSTITTKNVYDDVHFSVNMFYGIPRPLSINYFGLMKLPLTLATTFRKDLLTARKVNNNPITFSTGSSGNTVHTINSRYNAGSSVKHVTNINSNISSVGSGSGHYTTNLLNEFSIGSITVIANITKQQKNGTLESMHHSPSNNINNNIPSSTNGSVSSPSVHNNNFTRHQQKSITTSLSNTLLNNNFGCLNGKNKTGPASTSIAPIAIVNPTSRLSASSSSSTVHTNNNNSNIVHNSNHIHSLHRSTSINYNNNAVGTDRVKLIKRSPISKFSNLKSTYFTPKILTELLIGNGKTMTANILSIQNGIHNCDNAIQAHTIKYYRNNSRYSSYGKRLIYKLGQNEQRTSSIQHNYTTALNTISSVRERKLKSRQVSLLP